MASSPLRWHTPFSKNPHERGMFLSIVEGGTFNMWAGAVSGNYLTGVALYLGASGLALGLLGAVGAFATMTQFFTAPLVHGVKKRRNFLAAFSGTQRFMASIGGLLALALYPRPIALPLFVVIQLLAWAFMGPPTIVWQGYMTDLVPVEIRGRYFASRSSWTGALGMVVVLVYGRILDHWQGAPGFHILYWCAFVSAALNLAAWLFFPELPAPETVPQQSFWATIRTPLLTPGLHRPVTLFFACWNIAQNMAAPFFAVVMLKQLHLSFWTVSLLSTLSAITSILTGPVWGRLQDRMGEGRTISILSAMLAVVPLLYYLSGIGGLPVLVLASIIQGTAGNGMGLANQTLNMKLAPGNNRAAYFGFFAIAGGLAAFVTSVAAGPLTSHFLNGLMLTSAVVSGVLSILWHQRLKPIVVTA